MGSPRLVTLVAFVLACACAGATGPEQVACTGTGLSTIRPGVLTVGSDVAYAPFESLDPATRKPVGFDVDLATEVARRNGLGVRFVHQTFSGAIAGLLARRYDVVASAMTISDERRAQLCFSDPYFDANQAVVVNRTKTPSLKSTDDLAGRTVGVERGATGASWANEHLKGTVKSYETAEDAFADLRAGRIDAIVADLAQGLHRRKLEPQTFAVVQEIPTDEQYGIAVHPENAGLLAAVNRALGEIRADGTYDRTYERWFGREPSA